MSVVFWGVFLLFVCLFGWLGFCLFWFFLLIFLWGKLLDKTEEMHPHPCYSPFFILYLLIFLFFDVKSLFLCMLAASLNQFGPCTHIKSGKLESSLRGRPPRPSKFKYLGVLYTSDGKVERELVNHRQQCGHYTGLLRWWWAKKPKFSIYPLIW